MITNRLSGPYKHLYWSLIICNCTIPLVFWFKRFRTNIIALFVSMSVNVGMWLERFVIIVQSLHRDFLPSSWGMYSPTIWDWGMYIGTIGFFLFMFMHFIRLLPIIAIFEMRMMVPRSGVTGRPADRRRTARAARVVAATAETITERPRKHGAAH